MVHTGGTMTAILQGKKTERSVHVDSLHTEGCVTFTATLWLNNSFHKILTCALNMLVKQTF